MANLREFESHQGSANRVRPVSDLAAAVKASRSRTVNWRVFFRTPRNYDRAVNRRDNCDGHKRYQVYDLGKEVIDLAGFGAI